MAFRKAVFRKKGYPSNGVDGGRSQPADGRRDPEETLSVDREPVGQGNAVLLLVDDDEQLRGLTAMHLRSLGYSMVEAGNAEAAATLAYSVDTLDLVITDLVMPGAGGLGLAARLKADRPDLPLVFITGHPDQVSADDYPVLPKSFRMADLARVIASRLGRTA